MEWGSTWPTALYEIERIEAFTNPPALNFVLLVTMFKLKMLPDLTESDNIAAVIVALKNAMCCDGFLGTCDMTHPYCVKAGYTTADCVDASMVPWSPAMSKAQALAAHIPRNCQILNADIENAANALNAMSFQCESTRYKECHMADGTPGICYNRVFLLLSCQLGSGNGLIAMRKEQIALGVGDLCDPCNTCCTLLYGYWVICPLWATIITVAIRALTLYIVPLLSYRIVACLARVHGAWNWCNAEA